MTVVGTQIDSDKRLIQFETYEDYLDSLVTFVDLGYLGNLNIARRLAELGYRCTSETLDEETFYRRLEAVKNLLFPVYRSYELTSEQVTPRDMRNLWRGEVAIEQHLPQEQGVNALDEHFAKIKETGENEEIAVSNLLKSESFELVRSDTFEDESSLQPVRKHPEPPTNASSPQHYRQGREMVSIVGTYQHESNENLDEYFKAVGVPYIPRKMMCMSSPRLEISNNCDKWTIRTITMIRTAEVTFTLGEEYEEHMPAGVTLKNITTMEGDNLVTVSVGPDNNKVVRKYEITKDGVVLIMTHEKSGQVGKRYFKRLS
ncbi:uncharacterized protein LOC132906406 isoform X2 [Bombus pascuorum]|uniref:uncharacterized protein LOC132906406 isoform X2 n=1 Tax=Bombus pascuorum TaxID=65598 RepID=UPI00298DC729|nr:uncharacterized protein LOC132906406 isoform X2 [Bombus pascuorum]